jgi:hypothetical protein
MTEPWGKLTTWIDQWLTHDQRSTRGELGAAMLLPCSGRSVRREERNKQFNQATFRSKKATLTLAIPQSQESLIAALSPCIRDSESEESDFEERTADRFIQTASEEDEIDQLRRLGSWDTNGTFGTIGTNLSSSTLSMNDLYTNFSPVFDDDGNEIDPKLLQKTIESSKKRHSQRKRLVKFDYPPVSSMRECPRVDEDDLSKVFFAEGELEQFENDRISTNVADDIEIVAVASSSSSEQDLSPAQGTAENTPQDRLASNYVPTPRRKRSSREESTTFEYANNAKGKFSIHRHHTPNGDSPIYRSGNSNLVPRRKEKRLIKSVQIYLRERSVCHSR